VEQLLHLGVGEKLPIPVEVGESRAAAQGIVEVVPE
jgi:hypothetical protein